MADPATAKVAARVITTSDSCGMFYDGNRLSQAKMNESHFLCSLVLLFFSVHVSLTGIWLEGIVPVVAESSDGGFRYDGV